MKPYEFPNKVLILGRLARLNRPVDLSCQLESALLIEVVDDRVYVCVKFAHEVQEWRVRFVIAVQDPLFEYLLDGSAFRSVGSLS